jgi:hypothetical protein
MISQAAGVVQVVEHLPRKHKEISSNSSTRRKKGRKRKERNHKMISPCKIYKSKVSDFRLAFWHAQVTTIIFQIHFRFSIFIAIFTTLLCHWFFPRLYSPDSLKMRWVIAIVVSFLVHSTILEESQMFRNKKQNAKEED